MIDEAFLNWPSIPDRPVLPQHEHEPTGQSLNIALTGKRWQDLESEDIYSLLWDSSFLTAEAFNAAFPAILKYSLDEGLVVELVLLMLGEHSYNGWPESWPFSLTQIDVIRVALGRALATGFISKADEDELLLAFMRTSLEG